MPWPPEDPIAEGVLPMSYRAKLTYLADAMRFIGGGWIISLGAAEAEALGAFASEEIGRWKSLPDDDQEFEP